MERGPVGPLGKAPFGRSRTEQPSTTIGSVGLPAFPV
jgi:hypothetical protein